MADIWLNDASKSGGYRIGAGSVIIISLATVGASLLLIWHFWNQHEKAEGSGVPANQSTASIVNPAPGEANIAVDECNRAFTELRARPWCVIGGSAETTGRLHQYPKTASFFLRHMRKDGDPYIALWSSYICVEWNLDREDAYRQLKEGIHSTAAISRDFTATALGNLRSLDAAATLKAAIKDETDNRALHAEIDGLNRFSKMDPPTEASQLAKATLEELRSSTDPNIKKVLKDIEIARKINEEHDR